jgi:hypothetical protein
LVEAISHDVAPIEIHPIPNFCVVTFVLVSKSASDSFPASRVCQVIHEDWVGMWKPKKPKAETQLQSGDYSCPFPAMTSVPQSPHLKALTESWQTQGRIQIHYGSQLPSRNWAFGDVPCHTHPNAIT